MTESTAINTVGLIGLGNMGAALAKRLSATFQVVGFDLDPGRREQAAAHGVKVVSSAAEVADSAPAIVLSLPHPAASRATIDLLLERPGIAGATVIETSTVLPTDAREMGARCAERGVGYVDAAIQSGVASVIAGDTQLLIGGPAEAVAAAASVLEAITHRRHHLGDTGAGMAAKVVNNAVAHDVYVVLSEALALWRAHGLELDTFVEIIGDPEGGLVRPLTHRIGERLADRNFEGGMPTDAARKDSVLALEMAQRAGVPLFATQAVHTVYDLALAAGLGRSDYSAVATLWEGWEKRA